jgi:two-component system response regulator FixJ
MNRPLFLNNADSCVIRVVDDDASFRRSIQRLLQAAGYQVQGYASVGEMLLVGTGNAPGCILLDIHMPGPSGLDLQEMLMAGERPLPIIFVTGDATVQDGVRAMKAGAVDFLIKPVQSEALLTVIANAIDSDSGQRKQYGYICALQQRYATLSPREREVLEMVAKGALNKQISAALGAAERTVKAHRANAMAKMEVRTLAALVQAVEQLNGATHVGQRAGY